MKENDFKCVKCEKCGKFLTKNEIQKRAYFQPVQYISWICDKCYKIWDREEE